MKQIFLVLVLFLTGCSSNDEASVVEKKDKNHEYVYSTNGDDLSLKNILSSNDRIEDFDMIQTNFQSNYSEILKVKNIFDFEQVHININSDDASRLERSITEDDAKIKDLRISNKSKIEEGAYSFGWSSKILYNTYDDDKFISLITLSNSFIYPGHTFSQVSLYSFDKSDGSYLSNVQRLEKINLSLPAVVETVKKDFEENTLAIDNINYSRKFVEEVPKNIDMNTKYYILPDTDSIIVNDNNVILNLLEYSELEGDFTEPLLYYIDISTK